jgi:hypothetical protein
VFVPKVPPDPVLPPVVFAANNAIPPRNPIRLVAASERDAAPPLFTALTLNFNRPPALKKYLAPSALAKVTLAPNALVNVLVVLVLVHALYADKLPEFVIVALLALKFNLLLYAVSMLDCKVLKKSILLPATGAVIPVPDPDWCSRELFNALINVAHCVAVTVLDTATLATAV